MNNSNINSSFIFIITMKKVHTHTNLMIIVSNPNSKWIFGRKKESSVSQSVSQLLFPTNQIWYVFVQLSHFQWPESIWTMRPQFNANTLVELGFLKWQRWYAIVVVVIAQKPLNKIKIAKKKKKKNRMTHYNRILIDVFEIISPTDDLIN